MALFQQYTQPGVYTQVEIQATGAPLFGTTRIPVVIGEGTQFFTFSNEELVRGSSAVVNNLAVNEDLCSSNRHVEHIPDHVFPRRF